MTYWYLGKLCFLVLITTSSQQLCTYKGRGSLTSVCVNASPSYFRTTAYRFDNLDETLQCVNCTLKVIDSYTFDISGNQIKHLDLRDSQITTLKTKSFIGLVFLQSLDLRNNNIESVLPETFLGVTKIEVLNMEDNSITSLTENGFKELVNLRRLNLKNNKIKAIASGSFNGLGTLDTLDVSNNEVTSISGIFDGLNNLVSVTFEKNKISQIDPFEVKEMDWLLEFNLARNNLKVISDNTFLEMPALERLNLSSNPIEIIEMKAFRGLTSLEDLDLSSCLIEEIQKGMLLTMHHLRNLNLAYNRLTSFKTGTFSGLPELRTLNISHNKIVTYERTGLFSLHSLHSLDLSFNNLTDLDYKLMVDHLPALSKVALEGNPWPCWLKKEMETLFEDDNLVFDLGPIVEDPNMKCVTMKPVLVEEDTDAPVPPVIRKTYVTKSNGHVYVLYIFIVLSLSAMVLLFYLQYRNRQELGNIVGRSNMSEAQLINSAVEERDSY